MSLVGYATQILSMLFLGASIGVGLGHHFQGSWAWNLRGHLPKLKSLFWIWAIIVTVLFLFKGDLYPWEEFQGHKKFYFASSFVGLRLGTYLLGTFLSLRSLDSFPGLSLLLFVLISNFFAFDWGMSLEGNWFSSLYGMIYLVNGVTAFMALALMSSAKWDDERGIKDLFHLLLVCLLVWFYLHFSQFIIIWMGNLPREVVFYKERTKDFGIVFIVFVLFFKMILPLIMGLSPRWKTHPPLLWVVSLLVVVASLFEVIWLVRYP